MRSAKRWKDKILDYEIETKLWGMRVNSPRMPSWKDKILDYEIETKSAENARHTWVFVEKIRFSITRLKLLIPGLQFGTLQELKR